MALILFIDTSTRNCSIALCENGQVLSLREEMDTQSHAKLVHPFIAEVMKEANKEMKDLDAVVVAGGPGSYTGLRIGMSCAKGICYALDLPFIVLDTLEALSSEMIRKSNDKNGIYIATLDSRKGEIYYCITDGMGNVLEASRPAIVSEINWSCYQDKVIYIAGNTNEKLLSLKLELKINDIFVKYSAKNYIKKGFNNLELKHLDDLVYMEPNYLKPFK
ncbi:MAG: tRNA (adenosine(37)-N6)-threonylcarbamoyltransferase complex dimerization subunit type 1 TsaB [Candidatus Paceibacterota bacterium]